MTEKNNQKLYKILLAVCLLGFLVCVSILGYRAIHERQQQEKYEELSGQNTAEETVETEETEQTASSEGILAAFGIEVPQRTRTSMRGSIFPIRRWIIRYCSMKGMMTIIWITTLTAAAVIRDVSIHSLIIRKILPTATPSFTDTI